MPSGPNPSGRAWLTVGLLWVVGCLNYLDRVMITTMRASLKEAIPMTEAQFGLLTTAFLVIYAVLSPFAGFVADRISRSRLIVVSLFVWSLVTWLTGHVTTYNQLLLTRLLMGVSEACYLPAALALVADYHRGSTRSLATGLLLGGVMVGGALGGVGGWIAEHWHWSRAFTLFGLIGVGFSILLGFTLRDRTYTPLAADAQASAPPPVKFKETVSTLLSSGSYWIVFIYWGLLGIAAWMVIGWMPTFLQEEFQLSQSRAGLLATGYVNVASLIGLAVGGAWADRWARRNRRACLYVTTLGLLAAVPAILLVASTSLLPLATFGLIFYGFTIAFASTEMMPILCLILESRYLATGFGLLNFFACAVGGATTYAGGAMRDAQIPVSLLFQAGAAGMVLCALLLLCVKTRPDETPALPAGI